MFSLTVNAAVYMHVAQKSWCSSQKSLIVSQLPDMFFMNTKPRPDLLFHNIIVT